MGIRFNARTSAIETDAASIDFTQPITTPASTTSLAGLNIAEGVAPSSPVDGDVWVTAAGNFNARLNGSTVDLAAGGGGGNVSNTGTPVNNQLAIWTDATTIEGVAALTYDGTEFATTGIISTTQTGVRASAAIQLEAASPSIYFQETGATADEGNWDFLADSDTFALRTASDADGFGENVFVTTRSGTTVTQTQFNGTVIADNISGTNTGDQTSIVGITGTTAQFNTALTDGSFATGGGTATGTNTGDQTITLTGDVTGTGTGSFATTVANAPATAIAAGNLGSGVLPYVNTSSTSLAYKVTFANTTTNTAANYQTLMDSAADFTYNPSTNTLTAGTFSGALSGNATTATTATNSTNINTTNEGADTTTFPVFVNAATGNQVPHTNANLTYNANIGDLQTVSLNLTATGNRALSALQLEAASPAIYLQETGGSADEGNWDILINAGDFRLATATDLDGFGEVAMNITRSGTAVSTVEFPNGNLVVGETTSTVGHSIAAQENSGGISMSIGTSGEGAINQLSTGGAVEDVWISMTRNAGVALRYNNNTQFFTVSGGTQLNGQMYISEQAAAGSDVGGLGQLWVRNDTPNVLVFTDDTGTDTVLGGGGGLSGSANETITGDWLFDDLLRIGVDGSNYVQFQHVSNELRITEVGTNDGIRIDGPSNYYLALEDENELIFGTGNDVAMYWDGSLLQMIFPSGTQRFRIQNATIQLEEQANSAADQAAYGQVWVRNDAPNKLMFTTDTGDDIAVSKHRTYISTTAITKTSSIALSDVTGITGIEVKQNIRYHYRFVGYVISSTAGTNPGGRFRIDYDGVALGSTNDARQFEYRDSGLVRTARHVMDTTQTGFEAGTSTDQNMVIIEGYVKPGADGDLKMQFAQNTSNATASTLKEGASFEIWEADAS